MWELRCKIGLGKAIFCLQKSEVKINRLLVERILLSTTSIEKDNRKRKGEVCQVFRLLRWWLSLQNSSDLHIYYISLKVMLTLLRMMGKEKGSEKNLFFSHSSSIMCQNDPVH